jgi:serine/threonine protein kinase/Tfp pilus assembly protein PilF
MLMDNPPQPEEHIAEAAQSLPPDQRAAYLQDVCGADPQLRQRVEALLQARLAPPTLVADSQPPHGLNKTIALVLPLSEKPGDTIGQYKLLQQIGEGGCGVVHMAEQQEPVRRRVALKVIKLGMDTKEVIARFEAERQALALMDHPNIAKVLDAGATATGRPFFVMELVRGVRITDYCDKNNLPTSARLGLFIQVCRAIQHAHQKGIIHRDIKPSNILVTMHDGVPVPKVIDFGIAKATSGQRLTDKTLFTAFEQFIGTPAYMSPEQAEMSGLDIDTRSDIYSLGVLLYELLTGKTPFGQKELLAAGLDEMRRLIREKEPTRPSTRLSTMLEGELTSTAAHRRTDAPKLIHLVRGDLDWIVMKALEKDRTRRYETANGLAMDLERHLHNEPILARPASQFYRFQKLVRRNKLAFAAAGAVATALVVGIAVSAWQVREKSRAYQRAVTAEKNTRTEANKSRQIAQFLQEMLRGIDPSVAQGFDTKLLRKILDKTVTRFGKELAGQQAVEAELRNTIGEVYRALGESRKAEEMFNQALAIRIALFGKEHPEVATSLANLAVALMDQDRLPEAEARASEALAMRRKLLGNEHQAVADSLNSLGLILWNRGKLTEAEALHRQALAMRRKLLGQEHPDVAQSLNNLGILMASQGRFVEAITMHRDALAMRRKLLDTDDPDITASLISLSSALWNQGNLAEAETLQREAIASQRKLLGEEHRELALSLNNLATILWNQGKEADAEKLVRDSLAMRQKLLGPEHAEIAFSLNNLAFMLWRQGKLAEAEDMNHQALTMRRKLLGNEHADVAQSLNNLATVLRDEGKLTEAEPLQLEAVRVRRKVLTEEHPDFAAALDNLALIYRGLHRPAEAEPLTRECLAIREKQVPDDWITFNTRSRLGADLLAQKKYDQAEPLLVSGYEGMKQREAKIPAASKPRLKESLQRLVQLFEATNKPDQAALWKQKLDELERAETKPKDIPPAGQQSK